MESEKKTAEVTGEATEMVELTDVPAVISLPENCVEATIICSVYLDGKIQKVQKTLSMQEVQEAIREAENNYFPEDAVFTLTDKGRELAEKMLMDKEGL